jgi:hypothetical protein
MNHPPPLLGGIDAYAEACAAAKGDMRSAQVLRRVTRGVNHFS